MSSFAVDEGLSCGGPRWGAVREQTHRPRPATAFGVSRRRSPGRQPSALPFVLIRCVTCAARMASATIPSRRRPGIGADRKGKHIIDNKHCGIACISACTPSAQQRIDRRIAEDGRSVATTIAWSLEVVRATWCAHGRTDIKIAHRGCERCAARYDAFWDAAACPVRSGERPPHSRILDEHLLPRTLKRVLTFAPRTAPRAGSTGPRTSIADGRSVELRLPVQAGWVRASWRVRWLILRFHSTGPSRDFS